jgi:hypothetical protein
MVQVLVTFDLAGKVTRAEALTGPGELRQAAADAVKQWTYRPVIRKGQPVYAMTIVRTIRAAASRRAFPRRLRGPAFPYGSFTGGATPNPYLVAQSAAAKAMAESHGYRGISQAAAPERISRSIGGGSPGVFFDSVAARNRS